MANRPNTACCLKPKYSSTYMDLGSGRYVNMQRSQRVKFALFTKILFRLLDKCGETILLSQARVLVSSVLRGHKEQRRSQMISKYRMILVSNTTTTPMISAAAAASCPAPPSTLVDSVETVLRALVGEIYWRRAHSYMRVYIARHNDILLPPKNTHLKIGPHAA